MIYNELPPEDLTKIQERLNPVLDKFTKEVGEDLVKQTRVELEKVENRSRSLHGSSRPFAGGRESALNARACYMREGRLAHPTYTTATANLFRGLLANAGDLDHSGLLVELERRNGIQN